MTYIRVNAFPLPYRAFELLGIWRYETIRKIVRDDFFTRNINAPFTIKNHCQKIKICLIFCQCAFKF
jgi:hypothetical protein